MSELSFVALLPNKGVSVDQYINELTGEKFQSLMSKESNQGVRVSILKFKTEYSQELNDVLPWMGLGDAFNDASDNLKKWEVPK